MHQSKRNLRKYKKSLISCETNTINTELVISLKHRSKHEKINWMRQGLQPP